MMCKKPYMIGVLPFGCGQCMPCRINRRRLWTARIVLETLKHPASCFITLTYAPENMPVDNSVSVREAQLFLKRLRKEIDPLRIRYFIVGEYGDRTYRPHYHAALFGLGPDSAALIANAWKLGHVHVGEINNTTAAYVAGYVTKKMTNKLDPRLEGRSPEFARMSLRPGIGAHAMEDMAKYFETNQGALVLARLGDVPGVLRTGGKLLPLGRYLKGKLRDALGMPQLGFQSPAVHQAALEMLDLLRPQKLAGSNTSYKEVLVRMNEGKILRLENRQKLFSTPRSL